MIIAEERLRDLFLALPAINYKDVDYKPVFDFGSEEQLYRFLNDKKGQRIYPLIWIETPFESNGYTVIKDNLKLILATNSSHEISNNLRLEKTFKPLLVPLLDNCVKGLRLSGFTKIDKSTIKTTNYFDYAVSNGDNNKYGVWDAIKLTCDIEITGCKQRKFNF